MPDILKGEADIAIRMAKPSEPDLIARRTFEVGWNVYASRGYIADYGAPAAASELHRHRLVVYIESMHSVAALRWIEDHYGPDTRVTRVDNLEIATQVIATGGGIGVLPCFFAPRHPDLVRVFPDPVAVSTGWIVYHEAARDTARVRVVAEALVEFFETRAALYSGGAGH